MHAGLADAHETKMAAVWWSSWLLRLLCWLCTSTGNNYVSSDGVSHILVATSILLAEVTCHLVSSAYLDFPGRAKCGKSAGVWCFSDRRFSVNESI